MSELDVNINNLYNSEIKKEYFDTQFTSQNTKLTAYFDFSTITKIEKDSNKDAYSFNDLEIATVLKSMESSSILSIRRLLSTLNDYVQWAIDNGKRSKYETGINNVQEFIISEKNLNKYVSNKQVDGKILDEEEFEDLLNILVNPIDSALILCLYNFVGGTEFHEIRSLTYESIDEKNSMLHLVDKTGKKRKQKVEERLIEELLLLNRTNTYTSNNGIPDNFGRVRETPFIDSKYLFRPIESDNAGDMISPSTLYTRLRQMKQHTGYNYISPTSLRDTRLIHEILIETKERNKKEPTKEIIHSVLDEIYDVYGLPFSHMQRYSLEQKIEKLLEIGRFR